MIVEQLVRIDLARAADGRLGTQHAILDVDADVERPAGDLDREPSLVVGQRACPQLGLVERCIEGEHRVARVLLRRAMQLIRWYRHGATMARVDRVSRFGPGVAPSSKRAKARFFVGVIDPTNGP